MNDHPLAWTAPQPFWADARGQTVTRGVLAQPQILRFASDEFMNEMLGTLEHDPAGLAQYAVAEETWRGPGAGPEPRPSRWLEKPTPKALGLRRKTLRRARTVALAAAPAPAASAPARTRLKLYQPAHQRHYLVSGSLVCQMAGLPDREVDPARQKVSFVVRRLFPKTNSSGEIPVDGALPDPGQASAWDEYAFVLEGKAGVWRQVAGADDAAHSARLLRGEERLSMFPAFYAQDDGHRRRLFVGSVPVGRREAYQGAAAGPGPLPADDSTSISALASAPAGNVLDPRVVLFHMQVLGPWKALVHSAMGNGLPGADADLVGNLTAARLKRVLKDGSSFPGEPIAGQPNVDVLRSERNAMQISSWYLLLDLHLFLSKHLSGFWAEAQTATPSFALPEAQALYSALRDAVLPVVLTHETNPSVDQSLDPAGIGTLVEPGGAYAAADVRNSLIDALRDIASFEDELEAAPNADPLLGPLSVPFEIPTPATGGGTPPARPVGWPDFLFLFADPWFGVRQPPTPADFDPPANDYLAEKIQRRIDSLADLLQAYLAAAAASEPSNAPLPAPTLASMQSADMRDAWYVMRLVYERPDCAPFHGTVVSAATRPFQMAGFFDSDAPARPIRIGLPVDISPAGLRKFDKNAVFVMSDMLCGQVDRFKGLGLVDLVLSVLPWPFHKPLSVPDKGPCGAGVMCSLSIPIITICALILLTIIVSLLELIFHWLPFFTVCFPLPGFKGKKAP